MNNIVVDLQKVPQYSCDAAKYIVDVLLHKICPIYRNIRIKFESLHEDRIDEDTIKIKDVYMLSSSQICKCILNFFEIFKLESSKNLCLMESRQFTIERISWCITKLISVESYLDELKYKEESKQNENEPFVSPMYFVNWIDYTFDVLTKMATSVYRNDYKENAALQEQWECDIVEHITCLHMCIDELLLCAMTLCKYCLDEDQPILKARCHVVLRETKALFSELINVDITKSVKISKDLLKLPVKPSNVNILIDVLKDVLYVLETNTNTALLTLLIHCYVYCNSPVDVLRDHFNQRGEHFCPCHDTNQEDVDIETCKDVKDFDLYNERLMQIGSFAVSCSSDQKRILTLRSCLSSLESLDPHLVPAISTSPLGSHAIFLVNIWKQEVKEIRDSVFLIVDPVAFVERCKIYMKELLVGVEKEDTHKNQEVWSVIINIGLVVYEFFTVYKCCEPDALIEDKELDILLDNLNKAQKECNLVFNLLINNATDQSVEEKDKHHSITFDRFFTRVRLLYSLIKKIHELFHPKDDDHLFAYDMCEDEDNKDLTHTILNPITSHSRKRPEVSMTKSVFARTGTIKKPQTTEFLSRLTKHLSVKRGAQELNFSAQVSELFKFESNKVEHLAIGRTKDVSMRRALLNQSRCFPFIRKLNSTFDVEKNEDKCNVSILYETTSLQISAILNQINDTTNVISRISSRKAAMKSKNAKDDDSENKTFEMLSSDPGLDDTFLNVTQPSNVTTLERINDLDLVESKLNSLKMQSQMETNL